LGQAFSGPASGSDELDNKVKPKTVYISFLAINKNNCWLIDNFAQDELAIC
jgi:hypothetical protein